VSGDEGLPQDSGSTFGHIPHATNPEYTRAQLAYRAYFDHSIGCDGCEHGWKRCETAEELWRTYKTAQEKRP
jgi:hypothetical protein